MYLQPQVHGGTVPRDFTDTLVEERIPPSAALLLLCDLDEDWRTAVKRAVFGGFLDEIEGAGGARGGYLWDRLNWEELTFSVYNPELNPNLRTKD